MKGNPSRIFRAHYGTLVHAQTGRPMASDYLWTLGAPLAVAVVCGPVLDIRLPVAASGGLLTVSGLLSAYLFAVVLQISQRAMDLSDSGVAPSKETSRHATLLREMAANSGYASLVCIVAAAVFVVSAVATNPTVLLVSSVLGLALIAHLATVLLIVMQRVFALTEERLKLVRTGATVKHLPHRKAS